MTKKGKISTLKRPPVGKGTLIIVGGAEDKKDEMHILSEVARRVNGGKLVITTAASQMPLENWEVYNQIFKALGIRKIEHLFINQHNEVSDEKINKIFDKATAVFFTGGDQLKITTKLGGTLASDLIFDIFKNGGTIAGTSAGASAMGKTMLVGSETQESHKVGNWMMAPGLGLIEDMIIDQHFAQRGRIGRLLGAVALNPGVLGIGIDENTAIVVENEEFRVIGQNAVYVVDGRQITHTNISEAAADRTMSMHGVILHILGAKEKFDLKDRKVLKNQVGRV